jgi:hypothetical protein
MIQKLCKTPNCGRKAQNGEQCFYHKPRKPLKAKRPMKRIGKQTEVYNVWRDTIAKPYLDKQFGHVCAWRGCTQTEGLEVDHKQNRSTHPELKMSVKNVQYLCSPHHQQKTYGLKEV